MMLSAAVADASSLHTSFAAAHEQVRTRLRDYVQRGQAEGCIRSDPIWTPTPRRKTSLATLRLSFEARR